MPSARPAQLEPGHLGDGDVGQPVVGDRDHRGQPEDDDDPTPPVHAPIASPVISSIAATASWRIGRSRLPTRSDHRPEPIRPKAPANWKAKISRPASTASQCRSATRKVSVNVDDRELRDHQQRARGVNAHEGQVAAIGRAGRFGVDRRWTDAADRDTDATTAMHADAAPGRPGTAAPACGPKCAPSGGRVSAAIATPSGWAVWRTPIARPRSLSENQPMIIRPLAALTEPGPGAGQTQHDRQPDRAVDDAGRRPGTAVDAPDPAGDHDALAVAIGCGAERDQRQQQADRGRRHDDAGADQAEVFVVAQRRDAARRCRTRTTRSRPGSTPRSPARPTAARLAGQRTAGGHVDQSRTAPESRD